MKACTECGEEKTLESFAKDSRGLQGRRSRCKQCVNQRMARYYADNRDDIRDRSRAYRLANRDSLAVSDRERYQANKDRVLARQRDWYLRNKDRQAKTGERNRVRLLRETQEVASRAGQPWEPWEDAAVLDSSRTARELAFELHRSYEAVRGRRAVLTRRLLAELAN